MKFDVNEYSSSARIHPPCSLRFLASSEKRGYKLDKADI